MNIWGHEHWYRAPECRKYKTQFVVILGVIRENKKTGCNDYKSHLGIFQQNIFI